MLLKNLLLFLGEPVPKDVGDLDFSALTNNSNNITPGSLFLACAGATFDGRDKISEALSLGAVFVLYDPYPQKNIVANNKVLGIENLKEKLSNIASYFYNKPSENLYLIGVTGTNGKTTIAYYLAQAYLHLGENSRYIGTLGQGVYNHLKLLNNTTPDPLLLQKLLFEYNKQGVSTVAMEVSSHALVQKRVAALQFSEAIYTNLSLDHLDYHKTMEDYAKAKAVLFEFSSLKTAIFNADDEYTNIMSRASLHANKLYYGLKNNKADVYAKVLVMDKTGTKISIKSPWGTCELKTSFLGEFNVYNLLAVFTSLMARKIYTLSQILEVLPKLKAAPGRMELVNLKPCVVVDYAHTPDALENVLKTLAKLKTHRLCVVFGCGGDRDKTKRPLMGKIAETYADYIILTNDNPRHEEPLVILNEIAKGFSSKNKMQIIEDRKAAILASLAWASSDDIVLIAGKGHEDYQQIGDLKTHFSDQKEVSLYYSKKFDSQDI